MRTELPGAGGGVAAFLGVALDGGVGCGVEDVSCEVGVGLCYGIFETGHDRICRFGNCSSVEEKRPQEVLITFLPLQRMI